MKRTVYRLYADEHEAHMRWAEAEKLTTSFVLDNEHDHYPELQEDNLTEEEAIKAIANCKNTLHLYPHTGMCLAHMTVFYIEKAVETLDEDDEDAEWEWDCYKSEPYFAVAEEMDINKH